MIVVRLLVAALFVASAGALQAQNYPSRPIKIVVPFAPGGPTDLVARVLADHMTRAFGQPAIVENVPGAGGVIGTERVAKAQPDGYTLLLGSSGALSVAPTLYPTLGYNPSRDFTFISLAIRVPSYLVLNASVPVNTLDELIAYARKNPEGLSYSSAGIGTSHHTNMELFKSMSGVRSLHVPYRGSGPSGLAVISGEVSMSMEVGPIAIPNARAGALKMLAVSTSQRTHAMPDVPTLAELGINGFDAFAWFGLVGPKNLPQNLVETLNRQMVETLEPTDVRQKLEELGAEVVASTSDEFAKLQQSETIKWAKVIKEADIHAQ